MLLESKDEPGEFPSLRRNTLVVTELSRADLNAVFDCQASNNNISQPVSTSVAIEMHRKYVVNRANVARLRTSFDQKPPRRRRFTKSESWRFQETLRILPPSLEEQGRKKER